MCFGDRRAVHARLGRDGQKPHSDAASMNLWAGITSLVQELKRCDDAGHTTGALVLAYVCIDTMAFLSLPEGRSEQTRSDFIA